MSADAGPDNSVNSLLSRSILDGEGLNPSVTMEFFPSAGGILCGIREALGLLERVLPKEGEVWALPEGAAFDRKQVALRVTAPYLSFGVYETALLGALAH